MAMGKHIQKLQNQNEDLLSRRAGYGKVWMNALLREYAEKKRKTGLEWKIRKLTKVLLESRSEPENTVPTEQVTEGTVAA